MRPRRIVTALAIVAVLAGLAMAAVAAGAAPRAVAAKARRATIAWDHTQLIVTLPLAQE